MPRNRRLKRVRSNGKSSAVALPAWQAALLRAWSTRSTCSAILWPISQLYRILSALRRQLYRLGILKSHQVNALVLTVGNVIVGGAGKTPTVIAIVRHLQQQNIKVGVVSKGYGRTEHACLQVRADSTARQVGDEPQLIQQLTGAPVFVADNRIEAANALIAHHPETEIIVCDDGLQHYALHRDVEVCVFDDRGCGNHFLLPAGPLREPWPRRPVAQAGQDNNRLLVLHTGNQPAFAGYRAQRSLSQFAKRADGSLISLASLTSPDALPLLALAGIAQPESFFCMLRNLGLHLHGTLALPDHYDFDSLLPSIYEGHQLICTEKDARKLWRIDPNALAVALHLNIEADFFLALDQCIHPRLRAKLSSNNGHQIT